MSRVTDVKDELFSRPHRINVDMSYETSITLRTSKWSGLPHRSVGLVGLEMTNDGMWGAIRIGTPVDDATDKMTQFPCDAVVFFPTDQWWTAIWLTGMPTDLHVDISTPAKRHNNDVTMIDLDLDVVSVDGDVQVLDRDEFDENSGRWNYPAHVVANAEAATRYVALAITNKWFPFDGAHLSVAAKFLG